MLAGPQFARMKPSAYLINTARGGLIDHPALAKALSQRTVGRRGARCARCGTARSQSEPPYTDPRVIVTPHAAFTSVESLENLRSRTAKQVAVRLNGGLPENIVNRKSWQHSQNYDSAMKLQFSLVTLLVWTTVIAIEVGLSFWLPAYIDARAVDKNGDVYWLRAAFDRPPNSVVTWRLVLLSPLAIVMSLGALWAIRRLKSRRKNGPPVE